MQTFASSLQIIKVIFDRYLKPFAKEAPQELKFRVVDIYAEILAIEAAISDTDTVSNREAHVEAIEFAIRELTQKIAAISVLTPHYTAIKTEISKSL